MGARKSKPATTVNGFEWVLPYVVEFIQGPAYQNPIHSFMDEKCAVFDTEEENKFAYSDVHKEFNQLVENLIVQFLNSVGMASDQFYEAITTTKKTNFHEIIQHEILAYQDFMVFKKLMVKRNIELEKLALEELKKIQRVQPSAPEVNVENEEYLQSALKESTIQSAIEQNMRELEEAKIQQAIAMSLVIQKEALKEKEAEAEIAENVETVEVEETEKTQAPEEEIQSETQCNEEVSSQTLPEPERKKVPKFLKPLNRTPDQVEALRMSIEQVKMDILQKEKKLQTTEEKNKDNLDKDLMLIRRQKAMRDARKKLLQKRQAERALG